ncbi:MAG: hypothetical protein EPN33_07145 [Acidobacteria bacterium]|nr:MAG: hypothetical protein EPN33_07145 [Acidobacteriota bacterium]
MISCTHVDQVRHVTPRTPNGCEECLQSGDTWVQLRKCITCGHIGCCDSSKNKHATAHFHATKHPIMRAYRAGTDWAWCYVDQDYLNPIPQPKAA